MKKGIILLLAICFTLAMDAKASISKPHSSADQLRKAVAAHFKGQDLSFLEKNVEVVKVSFLINAKNELVISNVEGEDAAACDYVKNTLNFKHVDYAQAKQLTRYAVEIRLVK